MRRATRAGPALLLGVLGCAGRPEPAPSDRPTPSAAPLARLTQPDDRAACGPCHRAIVDQWAASEHATAWSDPVFQAGYAVDHQPECRACHAPLALGDEDPPPKAIAAQVGIACRVCHMEDGAITGPEGSRTHGGPIEPGWGTSAVCRSCHQFTFPASTPSRRAVFDPDEWMQRTYAEWEASGSRRTCQSCHMPWRTDEHGRRYRDHRMLGIHDVDAMAEAVAVQIRAEPEGEATLVTVEVAVDPERLAHAFPTGDMFRTARLELWPTDEPTAVQAVEMRRHFGPVAQADEHGVTRVRMAEVRDTRPRPGHPVRRRLRWAGRPEALAWRLVHLRTSEDRAASEGMPAVVNRRVVAEGLVRVPAPG